MAIDFQRVPAFCINLDTRPDRWAQMEAEFQKVRWPLSRWPAVRHDSAPAPNVVKEHAGALDSHRQLWQKCLDDKLDVLAVFEDDIVLPSNFIDIFARASAELPANWAMWHLHSSRAKTAPAGQYLVRILSSMWGAHGYLIRPAACAALLAIPGYEPADYRMTKTYLSAGGQPLGTATRSALCFQRGDDSDIPATAQLRFWREQRQKYCR
jgi:GR25 family glycosyltransferase involved in LPS biosynthesis